MEDKLNIHSKDGFVYSIESDNVDVKGGLVVFTFKEEVVYIIQADSIHAIMSSNHANKIQVIK